MNETEEQRIDWDKFAWSLGVLFWKGKRGGSPGCGARETSSETVSLVPTT